MPLAKVLVYKRQKSSTKDDLANTKDNLANTQDKVEQNIDDVNKTKTSIAEINMDNDNTKMDINILGKVWSILQNDVKLCSSMSISLT